MGIEIRLSLHVSDSFDHKRDTATINCAAMHGYLMVNNAHNAGDAHARLAAICNANRAMFAHLLRYQQLAGRLSSTHYNFNL